MKLLKSKKILQDLQLVDKASITSIILSTIIFLFPFCKEDVLKTIMDFISNNPLIIYMLIYSILIIIILFVLFCNRGRVHHLDSIKDIAVEHDTFETWNKIKKAQNNIILHAAYYPKYGIDSRYSNAFRLLLRRNNTINITVIITDTSEKWGQEFGKILRHEYDDINKFEEGVRHSITFFYKIQEEYPERVIIKLSNRLPLAPIVIIDNELLVGHYCHAETPAPNGIWMDIKNDKIKEIVDKVIYNPSDDIKNYYIDGLTDEEKAIARYIEDAADAIKWSKTI